MGFSIFGEGMRKQSGAVDSRSIIVVLVTVAVIVAIIALIRFDATGEKGSGLEKKFIYDVEELAKIDPNLIIYEESAQAFGTGLAKSHNVAMNTKGSIYVCGDNVVRIFNSNGDLLDEIKLKETPRCMAPFEDGTIYIGFKNHVETYDTEGQQLVKWDSLGDDAIITSIALSGNDVFVADAGNRIVVRYDTAGNVISHIGEKDPDRNVPGFVVPSPYFDLAVSKDGLLRVVDPGRLRIEAYTFDGDLELWWGEASTDIEGFCGCCNPVNIAVLPDGGFVTAEKGLIRVKVYNSDGGFVGVVAGPEQLAGDIEQKICVLPEECQEDGFDVAADSNGRIIILDTIKNMVRIFSKKED